MVLVSKQMHLVGKRVILEIHENTINYSHFVDVSVSIGDLRPSRKVSNRDQNTNKVRIITLHTKLSGAVCCNLFCLWVCVHVWVCYHDNPKFCASIFTKLGL